jgi:hypothetical protein
MIWRGRGIADKLRSAIELFVVAAPFAQLAESVPEKSPVLTLTSIHPKAETYELTEYQRAMRFMLQLGLMATVFDSRGVRQGARLLGHRDVSQNRRLDGNLAGATTGS